MSTLKIITTSDGSHSLLNEGLNETYHSVHGAIQESTHVFIKNGIDFSLHQREREGISILEVGFGTGLNALLTMQYALERLISVRYTTLEAFPLTEEVWSALNYTDALGLKEYFLNLHRCAWEKVELIHAYFQFLKFHTTLQQIELQPGAFDVIYFDAFAPSKQPELWTFTILEKIADAMKTEAVFVTYCAKGQLKRDLKTLGFVVETLAGPPGKKEMVRAVKVR